MKNDILALTKELNKIYQRLELKCCQLASDLYHRVFDIEQRYYSSCRRREDNGNFAIDYFPIPIIEVKGYCDIEVNLDHIAVITRLRGKDALEQTYEKFAKYEFEAWGADDHIGVWYRAGMTIEEFKETVHISDEEEIFFSFRFPFDVDSNTMYEFAKLLRREEFYM